MASLDTENGICIFGASSNSIDRAYFDDAFEVGRLIGLSGRPMIFGAGCRGLMGAAARGCFENGGRLIGVIPEKLNIKGIYFEDCSELIVTATMHERKATMERMASGFIALAGGFGTIEEFMEVLTLKQLNYFDKPIVLLNTLGYYDDLMRLLDKAADGGFLGRSCLRLFALCGTPQEALNHVLTAPAVSGSVLRIVDYNRD